MSNLNQRGIFHPFSLLVLLIIAGGIAAGVYLVQKTQIFKPKAASFSVEFLEGPCIKVIGGEKVLTCPTIQFKLISPLEINSPPQISLVKTAYAAGSGKGYFCDPEGEDDTKIFHKQCNAVFNFLCDLGWLGAKWENVIEPCDEGQQCELINSVFESDGARCVDTSDDSPTPIFPSRPAIRQTLPVNRSSDNFAIPPPPTPRPIPSKTPSSAFDIIQQRSGVTSSPTPRPTPMPTPAPTSAPLRTPRAAARPTEAPTARPSPVSSPTPTPSVSPRLTTQYRFAENPTNLQSAEWLPYTAGGVTVNYTFSNSSVGLKFIYAEFLDNQNNVIRANPFPARITLVAPSASPVPSVEPAATVRPSPPAPPAAAPDRSTPSPRPTPRPTPAPTPAFTCTADDYGPISNKTQWCACAAQNNDIGSLIRENCPQAPTANCQTDCNLCPSATDVCGNTVYLGECDYSSCTSPDALYFCKSSTNPTCGGWQRCGSQCGGT